MIIEIFQMQKFNPILDMWTLSPAMTNKQFGNAESWLLQVNALAYR